jgi:peptide/nickel transport system permease protein
MIGYISRRVGYAIFMLFLLTIVVYIIFGLVPIDPAKLSCGVHCNPVVVEANRHRLGLDIPIWHQWWNFIVGLFAGRTYGEGAALIHCPAPSFGYSFPNNACVTDVMAGAFPFTFSLAIGAFVLWMVVGISFGIIAARNKGKALDKLSTAFVLVGSSLPIFILGLLIYILAFSLNLINPIQQGSWVSPLTDPIGFFRNFFFAWITLALAYAAIYTRLTRNNVIETSTEDFIRTARAKGLSEKVILRKHNLRTSLAPLVTNAGLDFGGLLGGAIITETVFQLPGLGYISLKAVLRDYDLPLIMGTTLLAASFFIFFNLIVDVAYTYLDPRVRLK